MANMPSLWESLFPRSSGPKSINLIKWVFTRTAISSSPQTPSKSSTLTYFRMKTLNMWRFYRLILFKLCKFSNKSPELSAIIRLLGKNDSKCKWTPQAAPGTKNQECSIIATLFTTLS
jgi:hypothetical protein